MNKKQLKEPYEKLHIKLDKLVKHPFAMKAFMVGLKITNEIFVMEDAFKVDPRTNRECDEYEAYCMGVSSSMAELMSALTHLNHSILYLSSFSPTNKMNEYGINRAAQIQYEIENYLIRTQIISDRILLLVNKTFHLGISNEGLRYDLFTSNNHIKNSGLDKSIKKVKKLITEYQYPRNKVVHHGGYQDDDLRTLEGYHIVLNSGKIPKEFEKIKERIPYILNKMAKRIVDSKTKEFEDFNGELFSFLSELFTDLKVVYDRNIKRIGNYCGYKDSKLPAKVI